MSISFQPFWLKSLLFPLWPLALCVPLLSRMRIICSPCGLSDTLVDVWLPKVPDFLPAKKLIIIAVCADGKRKKPGGPTGIKWDEYERQLLKMSRRLSDNQVQDVKMIQVSFWDDDFVGKVVSCDWFVMCGFTGGEKFIEAVWQKNHEGMTRKRRLVAARVQCNHMAMWGVCGGAVVMGMNWREGLSWRTLDPRKFQLFEILPGKDIHYQAASGPDNVKLDNDPDVFVITSGTGIIMVTNETKRWASAFCCNTAQKNQSCTHRFVRRSLTRWRINSSCCKKNACIS